MTTDLTSARLGDLVTFSSGGVKRTGEVIGRCYATGIGPHADVDVPFHGVFLVEQRHTIHRIRRAEDVCNVHAGPKTL